MATQCFCKYSESREQYKEEPAHFCIAKTLPISHHKKLSRFWLILAICTIACVPAAQGKSAAYLEYIEKYHRIAVLHQQQYGIPASITLAQGLLESRAGRSRLAVQGNNRLSGRAIKLVYFTAQPEKFCERARERLTFTRARTIIALVSFGGILWQVAATTARAVLPSAERSASSSNRTN